MAKFTSTKHFGKTKSLIAPFNLNEAQLKSYQWFLEKGLNELLEEISPSGTIREKNLNYIFRITVLTNRSTTRRRLAIRRRPSRRRSAARCDW